MKPEDLDKLFRAKLEDHQGAPQLPAWGRLEERLQQPKAEHAVDALFRRKLENHPTPLPENLWSRLQARMSGTETKTRPMWVWYAAACIGLLLSVTGLWKYQFSQTAQLATNTENTAPTKSETHTQTAPQPTPEPQARNLAQAANMAGEPTEKESEFTPANRSETMVSDKQNEQQRILQPAPPTQLAVNTPKETTGKEETKGSRVQKNQSEPKNQDLEVTPANQPEMVVSPDELSEPGPVVIGAPQLAVAEPLKVDIILAAETEVAQPEESQETSRGIFAKRLAKNLLKVKNGEKPDLQELGLAQSYTMQVKTRTQTLSKTINL